MLFGPPEVLQRIQYLEKRVTELEITWTHNPGGRYACGDQSSHSPVTINQLQDLSTDAMIRKISPALYKFFQLVDNTSRNTSVDEGDLPVEETKALVSSCALMNARSHRFKGVQLLLSMMSIARTTNKQVHYPLFYTLKFATSHMVSIVSSVSMGTTVQVMNHCGVCLFHPIDISFFNGISQD